MQHLTVDFIEQMKHRLLSEQERLEEELKNLPGHVELGGRDDDNALEAEEDDINRGIKARLAEDLEKIKQALQKIENGTYGVDEQGNVISRERLEALPWADHAI